MEKKLPVGIQNIVKLLENDAFIYVDKTHYAFNLITYGSPNNFMSRPRRFGKSLFLSTLEEIFKGNKELFERCYIYSSTYTWPKHPVLSFDFSSIPHQSPDTFELGLIEDITKKAEDHGIVLKGSSLQMRLTELIEALAKKNSVVLLIDEYDKPIIDHLNTPEIADQNRTILKQFYTTLKSLDKYLQFSFITGVSRFTQVSLFSGPNHIDDITLDTKYAQMMGYTKEDLLYYFEKHVATLAQSRNCSDDTILDELKEWYNGYCFAEEAELVYNPFSTLLYFQKSKALSYWFTSGTPSFLIEQIKKYPLSVLCLSSSIVSRNSLSDISRLDQIDLPSLMFQTGYLTIKKYYPDDDSFSLDFPNREVRYAFFNSLIEHFAGLQPLGPNPLIAEIHQDLENVNLEAFVEKINRCFAKIPYHLFKDAKEGFYHAVFLTLLEKSGLKSIAEVATNSGRIDLVTETENRIFVFELKVDKTTQAAAAQIDEKDYAKRFCDTSKTVHTIGINFSSESHNISSW